MTTNEVNSPSAIMNQRMLLLIGEAFLFVERREGSRSFFIAKSLSAQGD
jgi:hypothetical protein